MERKSPVASLVSLTIAALLAGCGGSDGADSTTEPELPVSKKLDVRAVDGYLQGALVWLDTNGDYALTSGEPSATTDGSGKATLDVTSIEHPEQYKLLVQAIVGQTSDVGDGSGTPKPVAKTFTMSAPAGINVVTPLTTLVEQKMTTAGMTQAQAAQEMATLLGLGSGKADALLADFIAAKDSISQVYALNVVVALPDALADDKADALLTQGGEIGQALEQYLAQNPLTDDTRPDDIKVVLGEDGKVDQVIKDSDGDGQDDDASTPVTSGSVAAFMQQTADVYIVGKDDDTALWADHWQALANGKLGWRASKILIGKGLYRPDAYSDEASFRLTESGWTEMSEYEDIQMVFNADGSVSLTDPAHAGLLAGSCKAVSDETIASHLSPLVDSAGLIDSQVRFTAGAEGCAATFANRAEDSVYRIQAWEEAENSAYVNGNTVPALSDLFSSAAPKAEGQDAVATDFEKSIDTWSAAHGDVRLVLVRAAADATSGIGQLWQYNAALQGYQLLAEITPANHQGWTLQTVHGVTLLILSDAIQQYLNQGDDYSRVGFSPWQGRVRWVDNNAAADDGALLLLNKVAYDNLMQGRTLQEDDSETPAYDSAYASLYLRGTFNNWGTDMPMTLVADHQWQVNVMLSGSDKFKFDAAGDWVTNFGDNELDGVAEANGKDITTSLSGRYVLSFNDETRHYQLLAADHDDSDAAAAFAEFVASNATLYTLYGEQGNLGITKVTNASEFSPFVFDYGSNTLLQDQAHLGDGRLDVNDDDSVTLWLSNEQGVLEQDGFIRCTEVQDLDNTLIKALLVKVTDPQQRAVMEAKFASATFSSGARAYINTHSYADGSGDVEVVLNYIAYQDLLTAING